MGCASCSACAVAWRTVFGPAPLTYMVRSIARQGERTHAAGISSVVAERQRQKSATRTRERALAWRKAMLVGIIGVALVSIFWSGGECVSSFKGPSVPAASFLEPCTGLNSGRREMNSVICARILSSADARTIYLR